LHREDYKAESRTSDKRPGLANPLLDKLVLNHGLQLLQTDCAKSLWMLQKQIHLTSDNAGNGNK